MNFDLKYHFGEWGPCFYPKKQRRISLQNRTGHCRLVQRIKHFVNSTYKLDHNKQFVGCSSHLLSSVPDLKKKLFDFPYFIELRKCSANDSQKTERIKDYSLMINVPVLVSPPDPFIENLKSLENESISEYVRSKMIIVCPECVLYDIIFLCIKKFLY